MFETEDQKKSTTSKGLFHATHSPVPSFTKSMFVSSHYRAIWKSSSLRLSEISEPTNLLPLFTVCQHSESCLHHIPFWYSKQGLVPNYAFSDKGAVDSSQRTFCDDLIMFGERGCNYTEFVPNSDFFSDAASSFINNARQQLIYRGDGRWRWRKEETLS